jgi:hypothetical protein
MPLDTSVMMVARVLANRLCDREVEIDWTRPTRTDADGLTFRMGEKVGIEIDGKMDDDDLLSVFLHELGHAFKHADEYMSDRLAKKATGPPITLSERGQRLFNSIHDRHEVEADAQAAHWLDYIKAHTDSKSLLTRLLVMRHWKGD